MLVRPLPKDNGIFESLCQRNRFEGFPFFLWNEFRMNFSRTMGCCASGGLLRQIFQVQRHFRVGDLQDLLPQPSHVSLFSCPPTLAPDKITSASTMKPKFGASCSEGFLQVHYVHLIWTLNEPWSILTIWLMVIPSIIRILIPWLL